MTRRNPYRPVREDCWQSEACYRRPCGSDACRAAHNRAEKWRRYWKANGHNAYLPARPTQRLIEGLVAQGWSARRIGAELGWRGGAHSSRMNALLSLDRVTAATAAAVAALADRIGDRRPVCTSKYELAAATKATQRAEAAGWLPLAWGTDEEIAELRHDEVQIRRELRHARALEVHRLHRRCRLTLAELAEHYQVAERQISRWVDKGAELLAAAGDVEDLDVDDDVAAEVVA